MLALLKAVALGMFMATVALPASAPAQTRCEPTVSRPCNPPAANTNKQQLQSRTNAGNTLSDTLREPATPPREKTKLDPVPVLPEIRLDKDTTMGIGQGGGIIGLERKF